MAFDVLPYVIGKGYTNQVALGIGNMRVEGTTVYFTITETGEEIGITLPTPADGASITNVDIDENNYFVCTLSDGTTMKSTNPIELTGGTSGEFNKIESISVNGTEVTPDANKNVNIEIPDAPVQSISQNGVSLEIDKNGNVDIPIADTNKIEIVKVNNTVLDINDSDKSVNIEIHSHENKNILDGITAEKVGQWNKAEENVQSDWEQADDAADDFIKNKPTFEVITEDDIDEMIGLSEEELEGIFSLINDSSTQTNKTWSSSKIYNELKNIETKSETDILSVKNDLGGHTVGADVPATAKFTDTVYDDSEIKSDILAVDEKIEDLKAQGVQQTPLFAESVEWLEKNGDTSKVYVLPDGYVYGYVKSNKSSYTNVLAMAVDVDNAPYNGGIGYKEGYRYSTSSGEIENADTDVTGYIPIIARADGTLPTIRFKNITLNEKGPGTIVFFIEYDGSDKTMGQGTIYTNGDTYGSSRFDSNGVYTITSDDMTKVNKSLLRYFRITASNIDSSSIITIDEEITDELTEVYVWSNTGRAFVPADYEERIVGIEADVTRHEDEINNLKEDIKNGTINIQAEIPEVIIPSKLYGVVGHEFVLYYDNILKCMIPEDFVVSTVFSDSSDGILSLLPQFDRMLKFTPTADHIGTHNITIKVISRRTWETVATKESSIIIVADTARTDKKVLFIGDSLTEASTYVAEIERMTSNGIKSIGTIQKTISFNGGTAKVNSEGRSGWASYDYMKDSTRNGFTNPFYNPDVEYSLTLDKKYNLAEFELTIDDSGDLSVLKHHFDFAYYVANNPDVGVPDAVFINLGTNGGNGYALPYVYIAFDAMIERIRAYSSTIPIFLHLFPPYSSRGDGQRKNNGVRNVNISYDSRKGYYDCIKTLIERYENNENVIIVPTYTMLDTLYDFKLETVPVSARNSIEVTIGQSDSGHPAVAGYLHMADSYYNALQYEWSE